MSENINTRWLKDQAGVCVEPSGKKTVIRVKTIDEIPDGYDSAKSDIQYVLDKP